MSSGRPDPPSAPDLVLLDLDGTLVDTLGDLHAALQQVCRNHGRSVPTRDRTREVASQGVRSMLVLAGFDPLDEPLLDSLRTEFLDFYANHLVNETRLMDGIPALLDGWRKEGRPWGIVTNKPSFLTTPLLRSLPLPYPPVVVVSRDPTSPPKPDPGPVRRALEQAGYPPHRSVFVGDARGDIQAGQAAGVVSLAALWGYLARTDPPERWGADGLLRSPADLAAWLSRRDPRPEGVHGKS